MPTEAAKALRDKAAVCGVGMFMGKFPEQTSLGLAVDAFKLALDDAGLEKSDVDGLICLSYGADYDRFLESTGIDVRYANQGWTHGRFIAPMLQEAAMVIAAGLAHTVAIVHGRRSRQHGQLSDQAIWRQGLGPHGESAAYGAMGPVYGAALAARRYFHLYGGSSDDLAPVAMTFRRHAELTPHALRRTPMSREDYLNARWIAEPLRLFDCCQNNDGAACLILTSAERARDRKQPPVYLTGMQGVNAGPQWHNLTLPGLGVAQQDVFEYRPTPADLYAFEMAGVTIKDMDALLTYDAFTPLVLFALERFGYCGPGEAKEFIKDGRIGLGGELPTNTSGGLLSEGHLIGWNLFIEAVRQLRHDCGARQVKDAEFIHYGSFLGESIIFRR